MKTLELNIIKKNRKFFAATHRGYDVKIVIDSNSENLPLGLQELLLEDVSIRTKYGTDVIYKLAGAVESQKQAGVCTLAHRYNSDLVQKCRNLGGRFDNEARVWVFSELVSDKVDELVQLYTEDLVNIELTALDNVRGDCEQVSFLGYPIARAFGRDSGAKLCDDLVLVEGTIRSGGSMKNWATVVEEGAKFRLNISKNLLATLDSDKWSCEII